MKNIAVIGAGQLGSRHLQAFAKLEEPAVVQVVDPSSQSLKVAQERFLQVDNKKSVKVEFLNDVNDLASELDFCVLAMSANVRFKVLESLLEAKEVSAVLLEKVLFQSVREIDSANELLRRNDVAAWVNCPRRLYPFYLTMKEQLGSAGPLRYSLQGGAWGLACNGIHFLDHLAWLADDQLESLDFSGLDPVVHESKRVGFIEVSGVLRGRFRGGSQIELSSTGGIMPTTLRVESCDLRVEVDEAGGKANVSKTGSDLKPEEHDFRVIYQSDLTHLVAQDVFSSGHCGLTPFEESAHLHKLFIKGLTDFLERVTGHSYDRCPIT